MISFNDVSIHFGTQDVLSNVSFKINPRERCGIEFPGLDKRRQRRRVVRALRVAFVSFLT